MTEAVGAEKRFVALCPELLASTRAIAVNKVSGGASLLAFQLQFEQFDRGTRTAADEKTIAFYL